MNAIASLLGNDSGNLLQFIKYAISGCIATATHITIFHLIAWKVFFALQPQDWFVKIFKLPIKELDDATRSRNSMLSNGTDRFFSLELGRVSAQHLLGIRSGALLLARGNRAFLSGFRRLHRHRHIGHGSSYPAFRNADDLCLRCQSDCGADD